ncbi:MAG: hypothetical protein KKA76_06930, partial [Proteobacteria bacterium]|nr:hypothetical protein [Pseudomonadota bacterium]
MSKFYKANSDFIPTVVLERNLYDSSPVWESIVRPAAAEPVTETLEPALQPNQKQKKNTPLVESVPDINIEEEQVQEEPVADIPVPTPREIPSKPPINIDA